MKISLFSINLLLVGTLIQCAQEPFRRTAINKASSTSEYWSGTITDILMTGMHSKPVDAIAFSSDDNHLVSGSDDQIKLWNIQSRTSSLVGACKHVSSFAFVPSDNNLLVTGYAKALALWNLSAHTVVQELKDPDKSMIAPLAISPDGKLLGYGDDHGYVSLAQIANFEECKKNVSQIKGANKLEIQFINDQRMFISTVLHYLGIKTVVRFKEMEIGHDGDQKEFTCTEFPVTISPQHKYIAVAYYPEDKSPYGNPAIEIYDFNTQEKVSECLFRGTVYSLNFSTDESVLIAQVYKDWINFYDVESGSCIKQFNFSAPIGSLLFSHDSKSLAACLYDGTVHILKRNEDA